MYIFIPELLYIFNYDITLQDRYDKLAERLKSLQEQKRLREVETIMDAYMKSGKSFDELMTFLQP